MNNLDLVNYIRHGMILKNLEEKHMFDAIIYESFDNKKIEIPENIHIETLDTYSLHNVQAQLTALYEYYDHICIILDSLCLEDICWFLSTLHTDNEDKKVTIINLWTWASGLLHKWKAEIHDISISIEYGAQTFEPHDFVSMFSYLWQEHAAISYIRVPHKEFSGNLMPGVEIDSDAWITDLSTYELSGSDTTLLCHGWHITSCIQAHEALKHAGKSCDIFLAHTYTLPQEHDTLLASLQKTKQLIVVMDQHEVSMYQYYITTWLYNSWVTDIVRIQFITPDISTITTNQMPAIYEQANFGAEWIVSQILS